VSLPKFTYQSACSVADALSAAGEGTAFVAGGTDLLVRMKGRLQTPGKVIGLQGIEELRGIRLDDDGALHIGAAVTLTNLAEDPQVQAQSPWLREAIEQTASPLLRHAGTLGGNVCQESRCSHYNQPPIFRKRWGPCFKLGGAVCHVAKGGDSCYAVYAGDLAGPLIAAQASVTLASPSGTREIALAGLFSGAGIRPLALAADEILTAVRIPPLPPTAAISYQKLRLRDTIDYPLAGVSAFLVVDGGSAGARCREARLVLSAVGPRPVLVEEAGEALRGEDLTPQRRDEAAGLVQRRARPVANAASSPSYRREMVRVLARHALARALERAQEQVPTG
jgi:4-hydroxybenzoyl-CoA reductase subunit beta